MDDLLYQNMSINCFRTKLFFCWLGLINFSLTQIVVCVMYQIFSQPANIVKGIFGKLHSYIAHSFAHEKHSTQSLAHRRLTENFEFRFGCGINVSRPFLFQFHSMTVCRWIYFYCSHDWIKLFTLSPKDERLQMSSNLVWAIIHLYVTRHPNCKVKWVRKKTWLYHLFTAENWLFETAALVFTYEQWTFCLLNVKNTYWNHSRRISNR